MSDIIENQEPAEAVEITFYDLLNNVAVTPSEIEALANKMAQDKSGLYEALRTARDIKRDAIRSHEYHTKQNTRARAIVSAVKLMQARDSQALQDALRELHADITPVALDQDVWLPYFAMAYQVGLLTGHVSEASQLAWELQPHNNNARDIYDKVRASVLNADGELPDPISAEEAVAKAWMEHRMEAKFHPAHPILSEGWAIIWREAKRSGMCDVFDTLATMLGVPEQESPTRSGTVTVSFTGYAEVRVSALSADADLWDYIDSDDIERAIRNGDGNFEIESIDDSDLEWD